MRFRGRPFPAGFGHNALGGHAGGRSNALPVLMHIFGIFFLVVMGMAAAALARSFARDWAQRRFRNAAYTNAAGAGAVLFVFVLGAWLAVKILSS